MTHEKIETCSSPLPRFAASPCFLTACSSPTPSESESTPPSSSGAETEEKVLTFAIGAETTTLSTLYMNNSPVLHFHVGV